METIVRNIRDVSGNVRSAVEQVVGHEPRKNQQLVIQVVTLDDAAMSPASGEGNLPDWCNVYDGFSNAEIADIEKSIMRSHESRSFR